MKSNPVSVRLPSSVVQKIDSYKKKKGYTSRGQALVDLSVRAEIRDEIEDFIKKETDTTMEKTIGKRGFDKMEKKKIKITESSHRIAKKREAILRGKFKDLNIWLDGMGSINVNSKNESHENIKGKHIMSVLTHRIDLHIERYLPTAKEMAAFIGIDEIELQ